MNAEGLIFSTVTSFLLQPQKSKRRVKRDDLDTLSEVYTGPAGGEDSFIPPTGTFHPDYNLMTLISSETKQEPGLVVTVTLNYQGKLDNSGTGSYTSVPTLSRYWAEGEISYQDGYYTWAHRYTGRCVRVSFITNQIPSGNETNLGLAKDFLGFTNEWKQLLSINPGGGFAISGNPIKKMTCTDVATEDQGDGWFKVTETYQSKIFPGTVTYSNGSTGPAPPQKQQGSMFLGIKNLSDIPDLYGPNGLPNLFPTSQSTLRTTAGAQNEATTTDQPLDSSPPPPPATSTVPVDTGTEVAGNTGLDPAWGTTLGATSHAAAMTATGPLVDAGAAGIPLDF